MNDSFKCIDFINQTMFVFNYIDFIIFFVLLTFTGLVIFKLRHNICNMNWLLNCCCNYNSVHIDTGTEISIEDIDSINNNVEVRVANLV